MQSVTLLSNTEKIRGMAEEIKSYFKQDTLIPVSFAMTFVMIISGGIVSHTSLAAKVERLEEEMKMVETKYIAKEIFTIKVDQIQKDLTEIKTLLKEKK